VFNFRRLGVLAAPVFALLAICATAEIANAQVFSIQITADERCNGLFTNTAGFNQALQCTFATDPGPGGLQSAMFYAMINPPGLVLGDVVLTEDGVDGDLLRFDPTLLGGGFFFYSLAGGGAPADTGLPGAFNTNLLRLAETDIGGGLMGLVYTPTEGQPGFVAGSAGPVTYTFVSDDVPEPATIGLVALGVGVGFLVRRKKNRAAV